MITIQALTKEISEKRQEIDNDGPQMKKAEKTKIFNRIQFLKQTITYLEQDNREEFLNKELDRINKRIKLINDGFKSWVPTRYFEKEKDKLKEYQKDTGIPKLIKQAKALRFILQK